MNTQTISSVTARSHSQKLAAKAGQPLSDLIAGLLIKADEVAAGPITTLNLLREIYGDDKLSEEFPRLDTEEKPGFNGYTENYEAEELVNGETKTRKANFFTDYWMATAEGKRQAFILEQIKWAQSKNDQGKAEEAYRQMTPVQLANLKKKISNAKSKGRAYIRKAVGSWFVMQDLAAGPTVPGDDETPMCVLEYAEGSDANTWPLNLHDNTRPRMFRPMAVGDVIKLDVKMAIAEGGNLYDKLVAQLQRGTGGGANKLPKIERVDQWLDYVARVYDYITYDTDAGQAHATAIRERLGKKKGNEHAIMTIGRCIQDFKELWSDGLQARYDRMVDDQLSKSGEDEPAKVESAAA